MRCHAASRSFVVKRENGIGRTARFEGTDLLKIFALKEQGRSTRVIQPRIGQHRRAMNVRANPLMR
jgi:hypothetical protein